MHSRKICHVRDLYQLGKVLKKKEKRPVCKWKEEENELWWVYLQLHHCMFACGGVYVCCMCACLFLYPFCVYPQCVCSLGHGTSACMPSIQLWEGGVVIVGLSIFHVLLACLFPPSNSLWGEKRRKKRKTQDPSFGSSSFLRLFEALFISYFFPLGLSLSLVRLSYSRVVFLESKDRFVLCCLICVSGKKCTGEMECEVTRRGREGKRKRERWRETERETERGERDWGGGLD